MLISAFWNVLQLCQGIDLQKCSHNFRFAIGGCGKKRGWVSSLYTFHIGGEIHRGLLYIHFTSLSEMNVWAYLGASLEVLTPERLFCLPFQLDSGCLCYVSQHRFVRTTNWEEMWKKRLQSSELSEFDQPILVWSGSCLTNSCYGVFLLWWLLQISPLSYWGIFPINKTSRKIEDT